LVVPGGRLMAVLTPHPHRRMNKFSLILGGMALQAGFGLQVQRFDIGVFRRISSGKFADPRRPN